MRWQTCCASLLGLAMFLATIPLDAGPLRADVERYLARNPSARVAVDDSERLHVSATELARGSSASQMLESFLASNHELIPVRIEDLSLSLVQPLSARADGTRFSAIHFRQHHAGTPVLGADLTLLVRHGEENRVVLARSTLIDSQAIRIDTEPPRVELARMKVANPGLDQQSVELVVVHEPDVSRYAARALVSSEDDGRPGSWEVLLDPSSGAVRSARPVHYRADLTGRVEILATPGSLPDSPSNQEDRVAVSGIFVRTDAGAETLTMNDGTFVISDVADETTTLRASVARSGSDMAGRWVHVVNKAAGLPVSGSVEASPGVDAELILNDSPTEFETAQANCFLHATKTRNFFYDVLPTWPRLDITVQCEVNRSVACDAHNANTSTLQIMRYSRAGGGCVNAAYSSVVQHEYGHIALWMAYFDAGRSQPTSRYHEGFADTTASLLEDDPCLFEGFFGPGCTRSSDNARTIPCNNPSPHFCGQAIAGAWWDLRRNLAATKGDTVALELTRRLWLDAALLLPADIGPSIVMDVLTLDDNDGDLSNGTPHFDEIADAFSRHGMVPTVTPEPQVPTRTRGVRR